MVGPAVTVRTYPGDWAKPVEAIDAAEPGDVMVIDAGGVRPGRLGRAGHPQRHRRQGLAGVVIDGAIRDTPEIRALEFPAFVEPGQPDRRRAQGLRRDRRADQHRRAVAIVPGDWIVGDDDGVMRHPPAQAVEIGQPRHGRASSARTASAPRSRTASTLSQVAYLEKWEKARY